MFYFIEEPLKELMVEDMLKQGEKIVCRSATVIFEGEVVCNNATVLVDAQGEITWIDNDKGLLVCSEGD